MTVFRTCSALIALIAATPALAQTPSQEELTALVRAQAAEIATLKARLDRIEAGQTVAARAPQAVSPTTSASPAAPALAAATPQLSAAPPVAQATPAAAPPPQLAQQRHAPVISAFAPQIIPPGPADRDIDRARQANAAGVTTEWGAGFPVFHSADGVYTFKVRGRILSDVSSTFGSKYGARNITTTGMRALRLGVEGGIGPHFFWQFENDFSEDAVDIVTAFIGWRNRIKPGLEYDVRAGHLFNDRSFEGSTGSDSTPFLERSVVSTAIIPQRGFYGIGVMPRVFWNTGHASVTISGDRVDGAQAVSDSRTVLARAHWNPIKDERKVLHLGLWGFDEQLSSAATTLTRGTVIGGRFNGALRVATGELTGGTGTTGYGAELGGYVGPLWLMGEAGERRARLDQGRPDFVSKAWSVSGGWFLTGDLPPYNPRLGSFGQPHVLARCLEGGPGAIELTARYENLDYTSLATGGSGWAATLGTNWYLNSFVRFQVNAIHWHTNARAGTYRGVDDGQTATARVAVTF